MADPKTITVANPRAAGGKVERERRHYEDWIAEIFGPNEMQFTAGPGDATRLVREAVEHGYERVVVVGGDGTINEAVNGLFPSANARKADDVSLAIFPAGTGGDFVRSIGLSGDDFRPALHDASDRWIDAGLATYAEGTGSENSRHFINISSFGSSGLIVDKVNKTTKRFGGKASFLLGTVRGLASYRNKRVRIRIDDSFEEELPINTVAVANGRYFGGSMKVAPNARVDDGELDVIVMGDIGLGTFMTNSRHLYKGTHLDLPDIREFRGKVITATPLDDRGEPVLIDLDGEQPGRLPVKYEVLPKAVKLFAPWDASESVAHT